MAEPTTAALAGQIRRLEAFRAETQDRLEVLEHQRQTFVPWPSWSNLSGRQRELAYLALFVGVYWLLGRLDRRHTP
jgi:hypothetical protein